MEIPFVGSFIVRSGVAAVAFSESFVQDTRGTTAKNHLVNKLFANANLKLNMQIHD